MSIFACDMGVSQMRCVHENRRRWPSNVAHGAGRTCHD